MAALRVEFPGWDGVVPFEEVELWSPADLHMFAGSGGYLRPTNFTARPAAVSVWPQAAASTVAPREAVDRNLQPPPSTPAEGGVEAAAERLLTVNISSAKGSSAAPAAAAGGPPAVRRDAAGASGAGRWFLDAGAWQPSAAEWALALAQLNDDERIAVCACSCFDVASARARMRHL